MTLIPPRLKPGDRIGVVSPSTPVTAELEGQWEHGKEVLETLGFEVVPGRNVCSTAWGYAATPQEKADDIHQMFTDDSIRAIICSQGGATANACLSHLDWDLIRSNPKIFLGISDITVLLNAIYHRTGLVTFHGNDVMWGFGRTPTEYDRTEFLSRLVEGRIGEITPSRERRTIRSGAAEGRLLGGNIHCLLKLAGTPYWPYFTDAIYFVAAIGIDPVGCDTLFQQLKHIGLFDQVGGVIVGYIDGLQNSENAMMQMEEVLLRVTPEYDFPILKASDFGHNCPNTTLPVGARVRLDADAQQIEILEPCVA